MMLPSGDWSTGSYIFCRCPHGLPPNLAFAVSCPKMSEFQERTFIMVKPDGVQRGLVGEIIKRFERRGFKLVALKFMHANEDLLNEHYAALAGKPFFKHLIEYMSSGPVVPMVFEGYQAVKLGRMILGETDPAKSLPGTIRADFGQCVGANIVHGSDAVETANREIALWFKKEELVDYKSCVAPYVHSK
ncbi:unnamed protein product [Mesocestoides corti]|uniref:Nucleoside diphosphate kinase n=2 Tax=Mesocestoides corti TaxID=53468 RepID=A0A0R3UIU2_MESCO|nr:unnamed protein product [Mesocestoides corti]